MYEVSIGDLGQKWCFLKFHFLVDELVNYAWIMSVQYLSFASVDINFVMLTSDIQGTGKGKYVCFSFLFPIFGK